MFKNKIAPRDLKIYEIWKRILLLYICSYGKKSPELREVFRKLSLA